MFLAKVTSELIIFKKALIIHEQNTEEIISVKDFLYMINTHIDFPILLRFSLYGKFSRKQTDKMNIKTLAICALSDAKC